MQIYGFGFHSFSTISHLKLEMIQATCLPKVQLKLCTTSHFYQQKQHLVNIYVGFQLLDIFQSPSKMIHLIYMYIILEWNIGLFFVKWLILETLECEVFFCQFQKPSYIMKGAKLYHLFTFGYWNTLSLSSRKS